jgi:hypothetical protein
MNRVVRRVMVLVVALMLIVLLPTAGQGAFYARFCAGGGGVAEGETCDQIIGWATFTNDADNLNIHLWTRSGMGYCFEDIHVMVVEGDHENPDFIGVPLTGGGCPKIGKFPIKASFDPCVADVWLTLPLEDHGWEIGMELLALLHASIVSDGRFPALDGWQETAWGTTCGSIGDNQFPDCPNWSGYTWFMLR